MVKGYTQRFSVITCATIWSSNIYYVFFAHLLILEDLDHHQTLITLIDHEKETGFLILSLGPALRA